MRWMMEGGVLSPEEVTLVIERSLDILDGMGVLVEDDWIIGRLADYGAQCRGQVARLPRALMKEFLSESERADWSDRPVRFSGSAEVYQGWYLEPKTGEYLPWTMERLLGYGALARSLGNVGRVSMLGMPITDGPAGPQPLTEKLVCWKWGIGGGSAIWDTRLCPAILRMWDAYGEGTGQDARAAFNGTVYMISPLKFAREEAAQYAFFAKQGWEVGVGSLGSLGGTMPVTPAGALAVQLAEQLFIQVLRRCIFGHRDLHLGNSLSVIDMQTGAFQYGRPEQTLLNMAGAQIAKALGAHFGGHGGLSDAREPGYESAMQKVASALSNGQFSGSGYIAAGLLAVDEVFSPQQMLLDNEALGYLSRLSQGVMCGEEDIPLDAIRDVGWGGQYLSSEHTGAHFRESLWFPSLFSTQSYGMWAGKGGRKTADALRQQTVAAMAAAPPLMPCIPAALEEKLISIIRNPIP